MKEVQVICPHCGASNYFYPSKTTKIPGIQCVKCDKLLLPVFYDLDLPENHQPDTEKGD